MARGGGFAHPLAHHPSVGRLELAGVEEPTEPCAESSIIGTIPVLSDDKEKTRLAASSTPRYPQSPPLTSTWFDTAEEVT